MKLKLKQWVLVVLYILFLIILGLIIKSIFRTKTIIVTEGKNYTCFGNIIQVCRGRNYDSE